MVALNNNNPNKSMRGILTCACSKCGKQTVYEMSEDEKNLFQNRIWAIKESYVKMTGEGLSHDFRNIYTEIEKGVITDESGRSAMFFEPDAPQGYVIAVAEEKHE